VEVARELEHAGLAIAEDAEQPDLNEGEVVAGRDRGKASMEQERELEQSIGKVTHVSP
jgi:hypothetical protein